MLVVCPACQSTVFPRSDDTCPSCSTTLAQATAAPKLSADEVMFRRVAREREQEALDAARSSDTDDYTGKTTIGLGFGLLLLGIVVSAIAYDASTGDSYIVWTGAIIAGLLMMLRGAIQLGRA